MGGLFRQFQLDDSNNAVISESGVRRMAAARLAINRINNKTDGFYDNLLRDTQVRDKYCFGTATGIFCTHNNDFAFCDISLENALTCIAMYDFLSITF